MSKTNFEIKYAASPRDFKQYDNDRIREDFLLENLFEEDIVNTCYSHYDRLMIAGVIPVKETISIEAPALLEVDYYLQKREMGIINIGSEGIVVADGVEYVLEHKDALYLGKGVKEITLRSINADAPAYFYMNSCPAHQSYPNKLVTADQANAVRMGTVEENNLRTLVQYIVPSLVDTCQLMMGITSPDVGSAWNTLPAHVHELRMEAYLYFSVPEDKAVAHLMGTATDNRLVWVNNRQCVISPPWSIHTAAGTSPYSFIWGMAGDDGVCDPIAINEMR